MRLNNRVKTILILLTWGSLLVCLCSCFPRYVVLPKDVVSIGVLPAANQTNDLDGPPLVRSLIENALWDKGYAVENNAMIDKILHEQFGITDGGQLNSVEQTELGKAVDVDALMYISLEEFKMTSIGFFKERLVEVHLLLVDAATGNELWRGSGAASQGNIAFSSDEAMKSLVESLKTKIAEKILKSHLLPEAQEAVRRATFTLPPYMR